MIGVGSLIYGLSRFVNGFIVDRFSARVIMAVGLLLCAASNFMFGFGVNISSWITGVDSGPDFINMLIMLMAVTIVLNQYFQGVGYPPWRTSAPVMDPPLATGHKDVYLEHLSLYRRCRGSGGLRLYHGHYGA